jgi:hypothetical protein
VESAPVGKTAGLPPPETMEEGRDRRESIL